MCVDPAIVYTLAIITHNRLPRPLKLISWQQSMRCRTTLDRCAPTHKKQLDRVRQPEQGALRAAGYAGLRPGTPAC